MTESNFKAPFSQLFATFFGVGLLPGAPGTYGSVACLPLLWFLGTLDYSIRIPIFLVVAVLSVLWSERAGRAFGEEDCQKIVIDEVVGVWIPLVWLPEPSIVLFVVGLIAFRLFDITKPGPVGWCDRNIKGGLGVMMDDVVAGFIALPVVALVWFQWFAT